MNIEDLKKLPEDELTEVLDALSPEEALALQYQWPFWARPTQIAPPGDWTFWLLMAGRGFGKTRVGAEWVRHIAENNPGVRIALVAPTNADIRGVMLEGESGLLTISPPWFRPKYEPSKARVVWPNGTMAGLYSAEEPERLRGPQCHFFWADEIGAWQKMQETWDMLQFGFRLGKKPRGVITTTPRPVQVIRDLLSKSLNPKKLVESGVDPEEAEQKARNATVYVTYGSTYDNKENLADPFFDTVVKSYEGTRLGRQELDGEFLEDNPNAIFTGRDIDKGRVPADQWDTFLNSMDKIVTAVDPAVTSNVKSDESGIVTVGRKMIDGVSHFYVFSDDTVKAATPDQWARKAVSSYFRHKSDRIIAEANNGGDLVTNNIRNVNNDVPCEKVIATRGKTRRAEPVAALYEQGRVHHVGKFDLLENQMCDWDPTIPDDQQKSPDRMDALVWGVSFLMDGKKRGMSQGSAI